MYGPGASYMIPIGFDFIGWMSEYVYAPVIEVVISILRPIISDFLVFLGSMVYSALSSVLFSIYTILLTVLDLTQYMFYRLSGAEMVHVDYGASTVVGTYMTNYFVNLGIVKKAFFALMSVAIVLCFAFTVFAVARASLDLSGKFAVGEVLRRSMKALLTFFVLQFMVLAVMSLGNYTLTAVDDMFSIAIGKEAGTDDLRLANVIFTVSATGAAKDGNTDITKGSLYKYYIGPGMEAYSETTGESGLLFNREAVYDDFNITKIDYVIGAISTIFMLYIMFCSLFFFVQRVFEIVFLYLVSPFFVASMPLDGGQRFSTWREMFVAKCIASYGVVITMRLYFIFLPYMAGGSSGITLSTVSNEYLYVIRILFLIGAGFAVKKSHSLILKIVSPQAAQQADGSMGAVGAMMMAAGTTAMSVASGGASKAAAAAGKAVDAAKK